MFYIFIYIYTYILFFFFVNVKKNERFNSYIYTNIFTFPQTRVRKTLFPGTTADRGITYIILIIIMIFYNVRFAIPIRAGLVRRRGSCHRSCPVHVDGRGPFHQTLDAGALLVGQTGRGRRFAAADGPRDRNDVVVVVPVHLDQHGRVVGRRRRRRSGRGRNGLLYVRRRWRQDRGLLVMMRRRWSRRRRLDGTRRSRRGRRRLSEYRRLMVVAEHVRQPAHAPPDALPQHFRDSINAKDKTKRERAQLITVRYVGRVCVCDDRRHLEVWRPCYAAKRYAIVSVSSARRKPPCMNIACILKDLCV